MASRIHADKKQRCENCCSNDNIELQSVTINEKC